MGGDESGVPLAEGRKIFPDTAILGGLENNVNVFTGSNPDVILKKVKTIFNKIGETRIILGSDCTLPSETTYKGIREVVEAVRGLNSI